MNTLKNLTETEAIAKAKQLLKNVSGENWTFSLMTMYDVEDYIWSYLYDNELQYLPPICYGEYMVVICHQELHNQQPINK